MAEGAMKCVKFLLILFNFIFVLCGIALIAVGVANKTLVIKDAVATSAPYVIIGVGAVIFFIAFFGCCGAWKESQCMVMMFAILLILLIVVEIAAAIAAYVSRGKLSAIVQEGLTETIKSYKNNTDVQKVVDGLQRELKCCGVNSSVDWIDFGPDRNSVPWSCCINVTLNCGVGAMRDGSKIHVDGCQPAVEKVLEKSLHWVIVAALVIAFLQILGVIFSCMLLKSIRSDYQVM